MENTLHPIIPQSKPGKQLLPMVIAALLSLLCYVAYDYAQHTQKSRVNMEKSSGRNGKYSNPKARQSAEEQYQKAKEAWQQLKAKTNKSPEDKQLQQQLEKQVKHLEKKKNWKGEHHSQKSKGN